MGGTRQPGSADLLLLQLGLRHLHLRRGRLLVAHQLLHVRHPGQQALQRVLGSLRARRLLQDRDSPQGHLGREVAEPPRRAEGSRGAAVGLE